MKFKRKKPSRLRGSKTHGYGAMKKHRGAGSRGGRGMAGSGKRGDAKKPSINRNIKYFGKHGFKSVKLRKSDKLKKINIEKLEQMLPKLLEKKHAEKKGNIIFIDVKKLGFSKLLGAGKVTSKLEINVDYASKNAIEKIAKAGGKVNVLVVKKEKPKKEEKAEEITAEKPEEVEKGVNEKTQVEEQIDKKEEGKPAKEEAKK